MPAYRRYPPTPPSLETMIRVAVALAIVAVVIAARVA